MSTDSEVEERLIQEVRQAMELAKEHGFRKLPELCVGPLFVVGRTRPGECFELIAFRGLQAQAVRAEESRLIMLNETDAGTAKWTGYALKVVRDILGIKEDG
ncbi:MAG TPA: hypothetical protein VFQ77_09030 [Pseudonocardiaceae bacterium]|nr:hypothetical protein [Pseudonocardiaceae bacterium]